MTEKESTKPKRGVEEPELSGQKYVTGRKKLVISKLLCNVTAVCMVLEHRHMFHRVP